MNSKLLKYLLSAGIVVLSSTASAPAQATRQQIQYAKTMPDAKIVWNSSGIPMSVRGQNLEAAECGGHGLVLRGAREHEHNAIAILDRLSGLFRIRNASREFRVNRIKEDMLGLKHVRLQQKYQGLKVVGGKMLVHFAPDGSAYQVNGQYIPGIFVSTVPELSGNDAVRAAEVHREQAGRPAGMQLKEGPELVVYAVDSVPVLAYELVLAHPNPILGVWQYYINADTGETISSFSKVRASSTETLNGFLLLNEGGDAVSVTGTLEDGVYYLGNDDYFVYNADGSGSYPDSDQVASRATPNWGTNTHPDRIQFSAAYNMEACFAFWRDVLGRNSFDNNGTQIEVNVLDDSQENNAFWYEGTITFCVITHPTMTDLAVMDVLGHEFGHGVNESIAGFVYQNEPGAIDESFADIFGNSLTFHHQPDGRDTYPDKPEPGHASWYLGADATVGDSPAMRDMRNPMNPALDSGYPSRYWGTYWHDYIADPDFDHGGVHFNNGVQNFMFYLLSEGGQGLNDNVIEYNVSGIGISNAVRVAYQSLQYMGPYTTYSNAVVAWKSAASDINSEWIENVLAAWSAVGLDLPPEPAEVVVNDYDGDGKSDFAVFDGDSGQWHVLSSDKETVLAWGLGFGWPGAVPVSGDYDGDGKSDFAVFDGDSGQWYVLSSDKETVLAWGLGFGWPGAVPVSGDFNGDGKSDFAVFDGNSGQWYVLSSDKETVLAWGLGFGWPGAVPVSGDYNGDGKSDFAVFDGNSGQWFVLSSDKETVLAWGLGFGWPGAVPVSGDYNGDGKSDFAVFDGNSGQWFVLSSDKETVLAWGLGFGWPGAIPLSGDYNGDGKSDFAVFDGNSGQWYVLSSDKETVLAWGLGFGWPGAIPVAR